MIFRELFAFVHKRPGMYGLDGSFAHFCIFLEGCHAGTSYSLLAGLREWLVVQLGEVNAGNNLAWPALVLELAFPEGWHAKTGEKASLSPFPTLDDDANTVAVETLFRLLDAFLKEREQYESLIKIIREYAAWLARYEARINARSRIPSEGDESG